MNPVMFQRGRTALLVGFGLASLLLNGCGGAGHSNVLSTASSAPVSAHVAQAAITVKWPARPKVSQAAPRLIPLASNSITVSITQGPHVVSTHTITRTSGDQAGTSTYTFDSLPVGALIAMATAYPNADGTGTAQATGSYAFVTTLETNAPITINMGSTIDHLAFTPATPSVAVGAATPLSVAALDAASDMVLTTATKLQWASSDTTLATVDGTGTVTGIAVGTPTISVTDSESGKSASVPLSVVKSVVDHITVIISGPDPAVHLQLVATAYDALGNVIATAPSQFAWSSSDDSIVTVDANGVTSEPGQIGQSAVITATDSVSGKSGTITINVVPTPDSANIRGQVGHMGHSVAGSSISRR